METGASQTVRSPYDGSIVSTAHYADPALVEKAVASARKAGDAMARMPGHERAARLASLADAVHADAGELVRLLARETGKSVRESAVELARGEAVLRLCAEEAIRIEGRQIPLDGSAVGAGKLAVSQRFPVGVVAMVVPFNAPINLACHKLGPALAAGNTLVLKTPPEAPATVARLFGHVMKAGFPAGAANLVHGGVETGQALVQDPRVDFISFTGSLRGGMAVKNAAGMRPCILELGGIGPNVVHEDADLERAADACVAAGYRLAGQSCASVQNVFVHESVAARFEEAMTVRVRRLVLGDPLDEGTDLGPVIHAGAAERIVTRIREAVADGARLICGGSREGNLVQPALLADVPLKSKAVCEEIFGPVVVLHRYRELADVVQWVNDSGFGINFGIFTGSIAVALQVHRSVVAGAVIVNGTSTFRPDQMPYGGDRFSGYGRECPRDTVRAMTRERLIVFN